MKHDGAYLTDKTYNQKERRKPMVRLTATFGGMDDLTGSTVGKKAQRWTPQTLIIVVYRH